MKSWPLTLWKASDLGRAIYWKVFGLVALFFNRSKDVNLRLSAAMFFLSVSCLADRGAAEIKWNII